MKEKLLVICTCTSLELMTATGVTGYLLLLGEYMLSLIAGLVFAKVIVLHFVMDYFDKKKPPNLRTTRY